MTLTSVHTRTANEQHMRQFTVLGVPLLLGLGIYAPHRNVTCASLQCWGFDCVCVWEYWHRTRTAHAPGYSAGVNCFYAREFPGEYMHRKTNGTCASLVLGVPFLLRTEIITGTANERTMCQFKVLLRQGIHAPHTNGTCASGCRGVDCSNAREYMHRTQRAHAAH